MINVPTTIMQFVQLQGAVRGLNQSITTLAERVDALQGGGGNRGIAPAAETPIVAQLPVETLAMIESLVRRAEEAAARSEATSIKVAQALENCSSSSNNSSNSSSKSSSLCASLYTYDPSTAYPSATHADAAALPMPATPVPEAFDAGARSQIGAGIIAAAAPPQEPWDVEVHVAKKPAAAPRRRSKKIV